METFSALLAICEENSPVTGEFPPQRPVTHSFDVFFDLRLNKRLSKPSRRRSFKKPSRSLCWHCIVEISSRDSKIFGLTSIRHRYAAKALDRYLFQRIRSWNPSVLEDPVSSRAFRQSYRIHSKKASVFTRLIWNHFHFRNIVRSNEKRIHVIKELAHWYKKTCYFQVSTASLVKNQDVHISAIAKGTKRVIATRDSVLAVVTTVCWNVPTDIEDLGVVMAVKWVRMSHMWPILLRTLIQV